MNLFYLTLFSLANTESIKISEPDFLCPTLMNQLSCNSVQTCYWNHGDCISTIKPTSISEILEILNQGEQIIDEESERRKKLASEPNEE